MTDEPSGAKQEHQASELEHLASQAQGGLLREFVDFLRHNKKWWLVPIIVVLLLMGLLIVLAGWGLTPFIYPVL